MSDFTSMNRAMNKAMNRYCDIIFNT